MTTITLNMSKKTIEITKAFEKKASKYGTPEYDDLMAVKRDNPDFRVVVRAIKTKKDTLKGLNYDFMKQYIERHDDENNTNMIEFVKRTVKNNDNVKTDTYGEVKKWFLETYPEINRAA